MTTENTPAGIIAEYNPVAAAMAELRERYAGVIFPVNTKDGMKDAKEVRQKLVKLRTGLEALRKEIKEPALRRTQAIDVEAKSIEKQIREIEGPIDDQIKQEEARIEAEKAAKAAAEAARVAAIKEKIDGVRNLPLALAGESSEVIEAEMLALGAFTPAPEAFEEFTEECAKAVSECVIALDDLLQRVRAQEQAAAAAIEAKRIADEALAAERAAIEAERAAFEAERAAMAAERAALAAARAELEASKVVLPVVEMEVGKVDQFQVIEGDKPEEPEFILHDKADELPVQMVGAEPATDWKIRQFALATAEQFDALAGKVTVCGQVDFGIQLYEVAAAVREGQFDAALAGADSEALVGFDNQLIDATVACVDALEGTQLEQAA